MCPVRSGAREAITMKKQLKLKLLIALGSLAVIIALVIWGLIMKRSGKLVFIDQPTAKISPISTNNLEPLNNNISPRDPNLTNEQNLVKDYLTSHLSELSPTKEVLGGKFYITKITFPEKQKANISYEDGHIALEAEVNYALDSQKLTINSFKVTKEN